MRTIIKASPSCKADHANRPETATSGIVMPYTLFQCLLFVASAFTLIFAMCATGRAGA